MGWGGRNINTHKIKTFGVVDGDGRFSKDPKNALFKIICKKPYCAPAPDNREPAPSADSTGKQAAK